MSGRSGNAMKLYHYKSKAGNFGDDLNEWLWDELLPGWSAALPGTVLVGVGTIINDLLPLGSPKIVVGSGLGYGLGEMSKQLISECRFLAVRGPRSAASLGLPAERGIIDPAALIADLEGFRGIAKTDQVIFIPHEASVKRHDWAAICARAGVKYVSPQGESKQVIREIAAARLVITESMHGAILADSFGVPWHGVSISYLFNRDKWLDWADSVGLEPKIEPLFPALSGIAALFRRSKQSKPAAAVEHSSAAPTRVVSGVSVVRKLRLRLRLILEGYQSVSRLRALAAAPGQLSSRDKLENAKARFRVVLTDLLAEFAADREMRGRQ